ncbi:MAG: hypothetical protein IIZ39_11315 [Blautia sp.]|nr:hypothetical protein [Blautia sp.]
MHLFISKESSGKKLISALLPVGLLLAVVIVFYIAVGGASEQSMGSQVEALKRALSGGAVRTYALTGAYPESLEEILNDYHITYDAQKYIVEYVCIMGKITH